jgi:uncharacterized membrane protein YvlD (DUF360 family)
VQALHAPPLHTWFVPQLVPFGSGAAALSRQSDVPVEQDVMPVRHGFGLSGQPTPAVQALHVPPLQTRFVPQLVPLGICVAALTQVSTPVAHEVMPVTQLFGFVEQARAAVQALQRPLLQTWFVPQVVPFGMFVVVLTQVSMPVAHEVMPVTQLFGFVEQARAAVQALQTPPLQTWFVPHVVPFGMGVAVSTHSS